MIGTGMGLTYAGYVAYPFLTGAAGSAEHLLIRAVVNGLLGTTTSTNTALSKTPYHHPVGVDNVMVYLPVAPNWDDLEGGKMIALPVAY